MELERILGLTVLHIPQYFHTIASVWSLAKSSSVALGTGGGIHSEAALLPHKGNDVLSLPPGWPSGP